MSLLRHPQEVKLIFSVLYSREEDFAPFLSRADTRYGPVDFVSERLAFEFTHYYEPEMGKGLERRIIGFGPLVPPDRLISVKIWTNEQEAQTLNERGGRRINIDPGYLAASKLILATGKDFSHRIYIGEGVWGDLTLMVKKGEFAPLPWTFPDYGSEPLLGILNTLRKRYRWQLKNRKESSPD